jgi:trehalose/maltose hydrolase-like predicted phosphorylase
MFHAIAQSLPETALSILQYRLDRLDVAFAYANQTGWGGARFSWETASSGFDVNPSNDSRMEDHVSGKWGG